MSKAMLSPGLRRILLEAVVLCGFAVAVGLSLNFKVVFNAFSGQTVQPAPVMQGPPDQSETTIAPLPFPVVLEELDDLLAEGALLVDARSRQAYRQSHLPGAVSLPLAEVEEQLAQFEQQVSRKRPLIIYCSGYGCQDSFDLGVRLIEAGYQEALVFEGGVPEWRDSGRSLTEGQP